MLYAGLLEKWHCSFDELISKHTSGQVLLLSSGAALWSEMVQEAVDKESKSKSNDGETTKHVIPAWAKESAANYEKWMQQIGMGSAVTRGT